MPLPQQPTRSASEPGAPARRGWRLPHFLRLNEFGEALSPHTIVLSGYALIVGFCSGYIALGLLRLIYFLTGIFFHGKASAAVWTPIGNSLGAWVILIPLIGGLSIGLMIYLWEPTLRGHGIPEAMEAVLIGKSMVRKRVALLKPLGTALVIGTGGPFGAEGPIIQTGGAIGSLFAQWLRLSVYDRRVLLAAGAAGGMAATFKAPLAGILVGIELIVFEFRARSFVPIALASAIATAISIHYRGARAMFHTPAFALHSMEELWLFGLLGVICGLIGWGMTKSEFWLDDLFEKLPLKPVTLWGPVVGALLLGVIGYFSPEVFGTSYAVIREMLNGHLAPAHLLTVSLAKFWALVISLGSGTTGGVFAPSLVVGGGVGAAFADGWHRLLPSLPMAPAGLYAMCAMAAVFGSVARAPFTAVVFLFELTHDPQSFLPLIVCVIVADLAMRLVCTDSMMTGKLAKRGLTISQDFIAPQLELWSTQIYELIEPAPPEGARSLDQVLRSGKYVEVRPDESVVTVARMLVEHMADFAVVMDSSEPPRPAGLVSIGAILKLEDQMLNVRGEGRGNRE